MLNALAVLVKGMLGDWHVSVESPSATRQSQSGGRTKIQ